MFPLKNIIFDLGAVLIDIDYKKTEQAFIKLGYDNFETMYTQYTANPIFQQLEKGEISNEYFYETISSLNKNTVTANEIKSAWNAILLQWRKDSLTFLHEISKEYNIYLLSNTNAIHQEAFFESLKLETGINDFNALFTKAYYSHEVHLRKPNNDIFEFVIKDASLIAEETLFIDDSYNNIDSAKALGFKTHLLLPTERIQHLNYQLL
jgi:glucose-1-phosphatase